MKKYFSSLSEAYVFGYELGQDMTEDGISEGTRLISILEDKGTNDNWLVAIQTELTSIKQTFNVASLSKYDRRINAILNTSVKEIHEEQNNIRIDRKIILSNILIAILFSFILKAFFDVHEKLATLPISFFIGYYGYWGFKRKRFPLEGFTLRGLHAHMWTLVCLIVAGVLIYSDHERLFKLLLS